jgi:hypothetical protein
MKTSLKILRMNRLCLKMAVSAVTAVILSSGMARAQFFLAAKGDLLAGFRTPGVGSYELVVNVGNITNFLAQPPGTVIPLNNFSPSQLSDAFSSYNNLQWSVSATFTGPPNSTWSGFQLDTIWFTLPRFTPSVQTPAPLRRSTTSQALVVSAISGISGGAFALSNRIGTTNADNNTFLVREPTGDQNDYSVFVEDPQNNLIGDFGGNMPTAVENTTPASFTSAVVSDLYQSVPNGYLDPNIGAPTTGSAYYVGYFTLNPDGTMTFTRAPKPAPQIVSFLKVGTSTTTSFTTITGLTYTLYYTNSIGLRTSISNWPSSPTTISGNGLTNQLMDASSDPNRFYIIGAH